mgnify:CR=1 FL=1
MGWLKNMIAKMLKIQPARDRQIVIKEPLSYNGNVMKNRIWYRGDPSELDQFFKASAVDDVSRSRFWLRSPVVDMSVNFTAACQQSLRKGCLILWCLILTALRLMMTARKRAIPRSGGYRKGK